MKPFQHDPESFIGPADRSALEDEATALAADVTHLRELVRTLKAERDAAHEALGWWALSHVPRLSLFVVVGIAAARHTTILDATAIVVAFGLALHAIGQRGRT